MIAPDDSKRVSTLQRRLKRWILLYHTVAPLKPIQWYARLRWVIYRQLYRRCNGFTCRYYWKRAARMASAPIKMLLHADYRRNLQLNGNKADILCDADVICRREFTFLNETAHAASGSCWSDPAQSQLWRYHLHYFEFAVTLGAAYSLTEDSRYYQSFRELVTDWIEHNTIGIADGWHPYTISLRCVNWIIAYCLFLPLIKGDSAFNDAILASLAAQLLFLRRHLEFDVGGNHLLENIRALHWGGEFFDNQQWSAVAHKLLLQQLDEQILPDGGHYERSPMYHSIVLWDILEMLAVARNAGHPLPEQVGQRAQQMVGWLIALLHPDGEIALFNDAIFHEAPSPAQLGSMVSALFPDRTTPAGGDVTLKQCLLTDIVQSNMRRDNANNDAEASGYYFLGEKGSQQGWLVMDAGEPCPAHLPAHAHCDLLSYELSLGTQRMIVDSGVYQYAAGPWREYCRSTRAHNTVSIDGLEQSEVWDSFRVGRRAKPLDVRKIVRQDYSAVTATHDGFAREIPGLRHTRTVAFIQQKVWMVIDRITSTDAAPAHTIKSYLHWHPDVQLTQDNGCWLATTNVAKVAFFALGWDATLVASAEIEPLQGWYCPEFGIKLPNMVMEMKAECKLPFTGVYLLAPGVENISVEGNVEDLLNITVAGEVITFSTKGLFL